MVVPKRVLLTLLCLLDFWAKNKVRITSLDYWANSPINTYMATSTPSGNRPKTMI